MRLLFLGSGDAFGSGGRFNTCILVESETGAFLIDCGASSLIAMRKYGIDPRHGVYLPSARRSLRRATVSYTGRTILQPADKTAYTSGPTRL